jgi:hypothetical protein
MKKLVGSVISALTVLIPEMVQAQGTVYLSNLGQSFSDSNPVASDSWLAAGFVTGSNPDGYLLDSFELGMANATGNPSGFTVMLYNSVTDFYVHPGSNLGTLGGSANPSTVGIYTYAPATDLFLSPSTPYFIVLAAGTTIADGAYAWNYTSTQSYNPSDGWSGVGVTIASDNGSSWFRLGSSPNYDYSDIAITATATPEPSPFWLLCLGSGVLIYVRDCKPCSIAQRW